MRKLSVLFLLLAIIAASIPAGFAQSRARRVGQEQSPQPSAPTTQTRAPGAQQRPSTTDGVREREAQEEVGDDDVVRVESTLVTIPVSVLDRDGRFISALRKEDFRIFEDGVEQEVAYYATVEQPFTVALVIDTSGSTQIKIEEIQDAAIAFVDELRPDDRVLVVSFDENIRVLAEPTSDRNRLRQAIRQTRNGGGTRLYDAVDQIMKRNLSRIEGRKAIVLFTDGVDTTSKTASYNSTTRDAEELDAMIYPVQYDTYNDVQGTGGGGGGWPGSSPTSLPGIIGIIIGGGRNGGGGGWPGRTGGGAGTSRADYERGGRYLRELATLTGGRHYGAYDLSNIRLAFSNIAEELRRQYSLGYYPSRQSQTAERRQIKVRVKRPNLVVRARDSYMYRPGGGNSTTAQDSGKQSKPLDARRKQLADEAKRNLTN